MKIIYHPKEISFSRLFKRYKLNPSDETTLFLLPGVRVVQEIENRYCGEGVWGKNLLTFKELSDFINETSPNLKKKRISQVQALSVIRKAAEQVSKKLVVFGEFSRNRDFLSSALSIISKLKQNEVTPSEFLRVVKKTKDKNLRLKFADIALLYEKYEALITEKDFLDDSDSVRAVSEEINKMGLREFFPKAKKLVVFGFSDFSLCELSVIKSFFSELPEMFFFVSDFEDLTEYRNCFLRRFNELSIVYEEDRTIMNEDLGPEKKKEFSEFRDSLEEVEYVSRQIKKLIVDDGAHASDFKVLVRSSEKRGGSVANIFEKNGIAVDIGNLQSLGESVYGRLAMDILRLKSGNFHRKDLFRLLHNPLFAFYLGNDERQRRCVNEIKKISSEKGRYRTVSGIAGWRAILKHLARENESLSSVTGDIQNAIDLISSKFGARSFSALTTDLRKVLSELKVEKNSVEHIKREETTRVCFDEFFSLLRELSFPYGGFDFKISDLKEYILLFSQFMGQRSVSYKTPCDEDSKRVSVIDFSATRGIDAKFIFLMGLSDTCFPRPRFNDFLLKPREKIEINKAVKKRVFDWDSLHYERERHLFHTLGSSASQKTFFSCFRYDYGSKEIGRCDFLGEMKNVGTQQNPKSLFELAVSKEDVLFNCILSLQRKRGASDSKMFELLRLKYGSDISKYLINGISAERERLKLTGNYTSFEGVLNRALPINFDSFSPSRLETYGTCPFKYFSQKVLKFDRCEEPEEGGATQLDLGSLAHKNSKRTHGDRFRRRKRWAAGDFSCSKNLRRDKKEIRNKSLRFFSSLEKFNGNGGKKVFRQCFT